MTAVTVVYIFLKTYQLGEFLYSHFNIEDGRGKSNISAYYALLVQERLKTQLKCKKKKRSVKCMEKVPLLTIQVKSVLPNFLLEISHWTILHGWEAS